MNALFYGSVAVSIACGLLVVTRNRPMHALVYLILLFLSLALALTTIGATFVAVLLVILYAGAILVLFVFAVMLVNPEERPGAREVGRARSWALPLLLAAILLGQTIYALTGGDGSPSGAAPEMVAVGPRDVGRDLFRRYMLGVEAASLLLLAGLLSAFHFGRVRAAGERSPAGAAREPGASPGGERA